MKKDKKDSQRRLGISYSNEVQAFLFTSLLIEFTEISICMRQIGLDKKEILPAMEYKRECTCNRIYSEDNYTYIRVQN